MGGKERVAALQARAGTLMLTTLRAANEVRKREDYVPDIETSPAGPTAGTTAVTGRARPRASGRRALEGRSVRHRSHR